MIGSQLRENVHSLKGSGVGLAIGILGTLYGCLGVAGATQNAFNRAWAVPRNERPTRSPCACAACSCCSCSAPVCSSPRRSRD